MARGTSGYIAMENETKGRKDVIVERFTTAGGVIGLVLGAIGLVGAISDGGGGSIRDVLLVWGIFAALGAGAGWLAGQAVAWMVGADAPNKPHAP